MKIKNRRIEFKGIKFNAKIGLHEEEKILGNEIEIDISITFLSPEKNISDAIEETLDYEKVYSVIAAVMKEEMNLLETCSTKIIKSLAEKFSSIQKIKITVTKLHPPIAGRIERVGVKDEWGRDK
ncbi:MAG: dihydroneopterin aldolase [Chitinophagales bacterium]|nr:dihydroneopterin aldolase [Chitinophagales bacterium]